MTDTIIIQDLEIFAYHGVNPEEKENGQRFIICAEMDVDVREAAETDDLNKTVSYSAVIKLIKREFIKEKYDLIETAADRLANEILREFDRVNHIELTVKKPDAPMKAVFDFVAVKVRRSRA